MKKRKPPLTPEEVRNLWMRKIEIGFHERPVPAGLFLPSPPRTFRSPYLPDPRRDSEAPTTSGQSRPAQKHTMKKSAPIPPKKSAVPPSKAAVTMPVKKAPPAKGFGSKGR